MYDSIIILGPTASGKTATSIALAKKLNTEIINADSMYIYKGMDIGTAKPDTIEMQGIKHHLIDIIDPDYRFTVAEYRTRAESVIKDFQSRNIVPIIVGGTGFYIDSLTNYFDYASTDADFEIREHYEYMAKEKGNEYVYNILKQCDSARADKLHYNDLKRVIRALEIYHQNSSKQNVDKIQYEPILKIPLIIGLNFDREQLYNKINRRVDVMLENGLIAEVKSLLDKGYDTSLQAMKAIGYKEVISYINDELSLDECIDKIKQHSRNYAKRQLTYFRRNDKVVWLDPTKQDSTSLIDTILDIYNKKS